MASDESTMDDIPIVPTPPPAKRPGFYIGHPKWGGRRKNSVIDPVLPKAIATCLKNNFDPFEAMIKLYLSGVLEDPDGTKHKVDLRTRVKLLIRITEHVHSRAPLTVAATAEIETRHTNVNFDLIMKNPALSQAAEDLALALLDEQQ